MRYRLLAFWLLLYAISLAPGCYAHLISLQSDNKKLAATFNWAVKKALSFRMTGQSRHVNLEITPLSGHREDVPAIPSYRAGYFCRTVFYARDFSQAHAAAHHGCMDEGNPVGLVQSFNNFGKVCRYKC
jgi:hypothetical protein